MWKTLAKGIERKDDHVDEIGLYIGEQEKILYKFMIIYLYNIEEQ